MNNNKQNTYPTNDQTIRYECPTSYGPKSRRWDILKDRRSGRSARRQQQGSRR